MTTTAPFKPAGDQGEGDTTGVCNQPLNNSTKNRYHFLLDFGGRTIFTFPSDQASSTLQVA